MLARVTGRQLDVERRRQRRQARAFALLEKVILDVKIQVAKTKRSFRSGDARIRDRDQRTIDADLYSVPQAIIQFEYGGVLAQAGVRGTLKDVVLVA